MARDVEPVETSGCSYIWIDECEGMDAREQLCECCSHIYMHVLTGANACRYGNDGST